MMYEFFSSDTHFGHENVIKFCNRPFKDVEEMDQTLIANWNKVVGKQDRVYHLGDFAMDYRVALRIRPMLNGSIYLGLGNHDNGKKLASAFQRVYLWREFRDLNFVATHIPMRRQQLRGVQFNVHGHVHNNDEELENFHINVSVENTDYAPVPMEVILNEIKLRKAKYQEMFDA